MILQSVANATTADEVHPRSHSTLKELSITFKRFNLDESQDLLAQLLLFPNLSRIHLLSSSGGLIPRTFYDRLDAYHRQGILAITSARRDLFQDRQSVKNIGVDHRHNSVKLRHEAIRAALSFGVELADTMLAEGDLEGTEIMLKSLGKIWGRKLLRDD